METRKAKSPLL